MGGHQQIQLRAWASELRAGEVGAVPLGAGRLVHDEVPASTSSGGKALVRGKVWRARRARAAGVDDRRRRTRSRSARAAPGIYGYSPAEIFYDNLQVTVNRAMKRHSHDAGSRRGLRSLAVAASPPRGRPGAESTMFGGDAVAQHGLGREGAAHQLGPGDRREHPVVGRSSARRPTAGRSLPTARSSSAPTTRALRNPKLTGDRGVLMAFDANGRRVPLAGGPPQARRRPGQRLAAAGHLLDARTSRATASTTSPTAPR